MRNPPSLPRAPRKRAHNYHTASVRAFDAVLWVTDAWQVERRRELKELQAKHDTVVKEARKLTHMARELRDEVRHTQAPA